MELVCPEIGKSAQITPTTGHVWLSGLPVPDSQAQFGLLLYRQSSLGSGLDHRASLPYVPSKLTLSLSPKSKLNCPVFSPNPTSCGDSQNVDRIQN